MRRVVAQGTFDILHPGHVHYLREAKEMGDSLHVIVARKRNVTHKPSPVVPESQRVEMVEALDPVDDARLGDPEDIFVPIEDINPAVIALGHDQHHDIGKLESQLADRGLDCAVERVSGRSAGPDELLSSGRIIEKAISERG